MSEDLEEIKDRIKGLKTRVEKLIKERDEARAALKRLALGPEALLEEIVSKEEFKSSIVVALMAARIVANGYLEAGDYTSAKREAEEAWKLAQQDEEASGE